uniref:Nuclear transcription factor Y gamma n=1 Tax=Rhipicephalus zambeziensis TaxID=60191 RepID=A0A224YV09_9ACAR
MQMQGQSTGQPIIIQTAPIPQAAPQPPPQQTQTLYQIQQAPGQPASVFLAPAGTVAGAPQTTVQIQTQQETQSTEDDGTDQ